jgi:hypothetical protein
MAWASGRDLYPVTRAKEIARGDRDPPDRAASKPRGLNCRPSRGSFTCVSTVVEIESAIAKLPKKEFWELASWFDDIKNRSWDDQMHADAESGKLDFLFEEAEAERAAGKLKDWPSAS